MRWSRFAAFILFITILQASILLDLIAVGKLNIKPDLLLILMVFFAVHCSSYEAIIISFAAGVAADLTGPTIGPHIVSYCLIGSILANVKAFLSIKTVLQEVLTIFITGAAVGTLTELLGYLKGQQFTGGAYLGVWGTALFSALSWPFLWWVFKFALRWMGIRKYGFGRAAGR